MFVPCCFFFFISMNGPAFFSVSCVNPKLNSISTSKQWTTIPFNGKLFLIIQYQIQWNIPLFSTIPIERAHSANKIQDKTFLKYTKSSSQRTKRMEWHGFSYFLVDGMRCCRMSYWQYPCLLSSFVSRFIFLLFFRTI